MLILTKQLVSSVSGDKKMSGVKKEVKEIKEKSVRRILKAALTEFQKKGFEGARVDEIARQAGSQ